MDSALSIIRELRNWRFSSVVQADLDGLDALLSLAKDPAQAGAELDSAAVLSGDFSSYRILYLVGSAEARLIIGDTTGARLRLQNAIISAWGDRRPDSAALKFWERIDHRIVMLLLAMGRVADGLDYVERTRASLPTTEHTQEVKQPEEIPASEVIVKYSLIADTLLAWTVRAGNVEVSRTPLDTVQLMRTIGKLEEALQQRAPDAEVKPLLSALYNWLLRPIETQLGDSETPLVFVLDERLAAVPFAALFDAQRNRYFVEDFEVRFASSLEEAWTKATVKPAPGVLLIANPAFDRNEYPRLDRLHYAREEVRSLALRYPGATVLEDSRANRWALDSALAQAGLAHFAGHTVFDEVHPERSHLVLAARAGAPGKITAEELSRLDLRHVQLIVLAGCRTAESGLSRRGYFSGLSDALLSAGVGGTVGSTWNVDDRFTAALMIEFHRGYQRSRDGPRALREAQLALLRSRDPSLRTPAAWAGFRYMGR